MAPKVAVSAAPTRTSGRDPKPRRHHQDIDGAGGASSEDDGSRARTTGKKHKKSSTTQTRKKARAESSEVELVDADEHDSPVEVVDLDPDDSEREEPVKHIPSAEVKPVKDETTRDLLLVFTPKVKTQFKAGLDKDGKPIYGPVKKGRWCKICKESETVINSEKGIAAAFFMGGNSTCRQHIRKHWDAYSKLCEDAKPPITPNDHCMPPAVKAQLLSQTASGPKEQPLDQGFLHTQLPQEFSRESILELVSKFVAVDDQAIMVTGKPVFRNIMVGMRPKTRDEDIPSPHDVMTFIHNSFVKRIAELKKDIANAPGKVHGTTDCWSQDLTSASFLGSTAHWIEVLETAWRFRSEVIGFRGLSGEHSGFNLARHLLGILERVGIFSEDHSKLGKITADNASNNGTMSDAIESAHSIHGLPDWDAESSLLGCLGHVIELAIEAVVTTVTKKSAVETTTAIWEFDPADPGSLLDGGKADVAAMVRTLSVKINASGQRKEYFGSCQVTAKIPGAPLVIPLHSNIRWGSLWYTLTQSSKLRRAISLFVNTADEQFGPITTLKKDGKVIKSIPWTAFKIPEESWADVDLLCNIIYDAHGIQQLFSSEKVPTLWQAIPRLEDLLEKWEAKRHDPAYSSLKDALDAGLEKLTKYHMIYVEKKPAAIISLMLHPYYKLDYITEKWGGAEQQQNLIAEGVKNAINWQEFATRIFETAVEECWDEMQQNQAGASQSSNGNEPATTAQQIVQPEAPPAHESDYDRKRRERMAAAPKAQPEGWREEVRRWLTSFDVVTKDVDLLEWWFDRRLEYPTLARLALDYLSIPASSVACERLFSAAKEIATHKRSRLGSERFEQLQMMKFAWRGTIFDFAKLNSQEVEEVELMTREFEEFEAMSAA